MCFSQTKEQIEEEENSPRNHDPEKKEGTPWIQSNTEPGGFTTASTHLGATAVTGEPTCF